MHLKDKKKNIYPVKLPYNHSLVQEYTNALGANKSCSQFAHTPPLRMLPEQHNSHLKPQNHWNKTLV